MKDRIALYLLTFLALSGVFTLPACARLPAPRCPSLKAPVSTDKAQSLRFDDKATGRCFEIGRYGDVRRLCNVRQIHEDYTIAYQSPDSPEKERVVYYSDKNSYGLKPISFKSNVPAGAVPPGQEVTITVVVATEDGEFQFTHEIQWTAGRTDLKVTRSIKKMISDAIGLHRFTVTLALNAKDFSGYEDTESNSSTESCTSQPPDNRYPINSMSLKVLRPAALATDKSSNSAKGLLGELSHDYFLLPKQAEKYDVVFGLRGDYHMLKDQSLTLNYVLRLEPKVSKEPVRPIK
jgi:hypothetical protein